MWFAYTYLTLILLLTLYFRNYIAYEIKIKMHTRRSTHYRLVAHPQIISHAITVTAAQQRLSCHTYLTLSHTEISAIHSQSFVLQKRPPFNNCRSDQHHYLPRLAATLWRLSASLRIIELSLVRPTSFLYAHKTQ